MTPGTKPRRWGRFLAWAVVGAALALGFTVSIGLFVLPAALVLLLVLLRLRGGSGALGVPLGAGVAVAALGAINLGNKACPTGGRAALRADQASASFSCGGIDGRAWLIVGTALVVLVAAAFARTTQRPRDRPPPHASAPDPTH